MPDPIPAPAPQPAATLAPAPTIVTPPTGAAPAAPSPGATPPATLSAEPAKAWGETWRQDYAGTDEKLLKRLERYASPKAALDALIAAQNRISSGELKKALPENAKPEELAAWRVENGIPETPEAYLANLPNGLVIGEDDKSVFESFAKALHSVNADPKIAHAAIGWYNSFVEEQAAKIHEGDLAAKQTVEDELRKEWGNDYRVNINAIGGLFNSAPEDVSEMVLNARTADGKAILNDPGVVRWLVNLAREMNPVATLVPGSQGTSVQSIDTEIGEFEKKMGNKNSDYWKGPMAEKNQQRYRDLIEARDRLKARSTA